MQNQRLLARLVEVTDQILSATDPAAHSKTYSSQGKTSLTFLSKALSVE